MGGYPHNHLIHESGGPKPVLPQDSNHHTVLLAWDHRAHTKIVASRLVASHYRSKGGIFDHLPHFGQTSPLPLQLAHCRPSFIPLP